MKKLNYLTFIILLFYITSCVPVYQNSQQPGTTKQQPKVDNQSQLKSIQTVKGVMIPADGSSPITSSVENTAPSRLITLSKIGEKYELKNGEVVNFIYDGIDPEETFIIYESTDNGYTLELAYRNDPINVEFKKLCHSFIVSNPNMTNVIIPDNLKYEQIVWTPREDGTWEVRLGTVERGCNSKALQNLNKLRSKQYEKNVPK